MGLRRWGLICGGAVCLAASAWQLSTPHLNSHPPQTSISKPVKRSATAHPKPSLATMSAPKRFIVSKIGIDNPIIAVGRTQGGEMAMPASLTEVGWFNEGAFPGNVGTAVLAAHTGFPNKRTAFQKMEQLGRGDDIAIVDAAGQRADFAITETAAYAPDSAPLEKIFGTSSARNVRFIICTGAWNAAQQTYSQRLVVFAERNK